jgi:HSP20 family protein
MATLSDAMDRLLGGNAFVRPFDLATPFWGATQAMPVDVIENQEGYTFKASVPGIKPEELDINVENNVLTIRAERKQDGESREDEQNVRRQERYYGKLERCFTLTTDVDAGKAKAELEHGVLTLSLPKAETAKPKAIKVQAK